MGTEDESMTKRKTSPKQSPKQGPISSRVRSLFYGRHLSLEKIGKRLGKSVEQVAQYLVGSAVRKKPTRKDPRRMRAGREGWKTRRFHTARHDPGIVHLHGLNRDDWHVLNTLMRDQSAEWKKFRRAGILNGRTLLQIRNDWFSPGAH